VPRWLLPLMIAAPLVVAAALAGARDLVLVFALYQVGICLGAPAWIDLRLRRWTLRRHLDHVGLGGPGTMRAVGLGLALAAAAAVGIWAAFGIWGSRLLGANAVAEVSARWGLAPEAAPALFAFMAVVNGPAEELFWRGFVAAEIRPHPSRAVRLVLPSLLYASYHGFTLALLVRAPGPAVLMFAAVAAAGCGWAWLRERTGSVWPALLIHTAATVAYMLVALPLLTA